MSAKADILNRNARAPATRSAEVEPAKSLPLPLEVFDRFMPLHVRVDALGRISGCGPTLAKLAGPECLIGRPLLEVFELRRPSGITSVAGLRARTGERLRLVLRQAARPVSFRGVAMTLGQGAADGGAAGLVLNLSFGIGVVEAVRNFALTDADFAPTDLAVEMMYMVEANTAAMEALKGFALRLQDDKQMAETQALTDTLTGLRNRRALALVLERMTRTEQGFGLMHIDLDYFKAVNDSLGHAAGDQVLRKVAEALLAETRAQDTVARVGGDEFVAVFPDLTDPDRLASIARRIIEVLTRPIAFEGQMCRISASIGITTSDAYAEPEVVRMQQDADEALYASKRAGRGQAQFHQPQGAASRGEGRKAKQDRRIA